MPPLLVPLLAWVTGILLSPVLDSQSVWVAAPLAILVAVARPRLLPLPLLLLGAGWRSLEPPVPPDVGELPVRLEGVIRRAPEWRGLGVYLDIRLLALDQQPARGNVRLTQFLDDDVQRQLFTTLDLGTGDRVEIVVRLRRPSVYRIPGVFNYRRYLERRRIYWTGNIRSPRLITVLERGWHGPDRLRAWIAQRVRAPFAGDPLVQGLVAGMVLGHRHALTAETERRFQAGGLYHLVVVSGFNLAIVAGVALALGHRLSSHRRMRLLIVCVAAAGYAALVEGEAPVLRAALMVAWAVVTRWLDRDYRAGNAICATALAILIADPVALEDASFQMSFAAMVAIVAAAVPFLEWRLGWLRTALAGFADTERDSWLDPDLADWRVARRMWCELHGLPLAVVTLPWRVALLLVETAVVSVCVEIAFLVFMVESFHRMSPVAPLLNIPAGVVAAAVTPAGLALIVLPPMLAAPVATMISGLLHGLDGLLDLALSLPMATFRVPSAPLWVWLAYGTAVAVMVAAIRFRASLVFMGALAAVAGGQAAIAFGDFSPLAPDRTTIHVLDVGQGDSILVERPDGRRILIDGGGVAAGRFLNLRDESTFSIGEDVVSPHLFHRRLRRIDVVVLSHAHYDHIDGLIDVVGNFEIGEVWLGRNPTIPIFRKFLDRVMARQIPVRWLAAGDRAGGFEVLHPPRNWRTRPNRADNNDSLVLLLDTGQRTALFTGDLERSISAPPRVDFYKVPHHGSRGVRLRVEAPIRVVSVGANNPFGHPHPSIGRVWRTDWLGMITVELD